MHDQTRLSVAWQYERGSTLTFLQQWEQDHPECNATKEQLADRDAKPCPPELVDQMVSILCAAIPSVVREAADAVAENFPVPADREGA